MMTTRKGASGTSKQAPPASGTPTHQKGTPVSVSITDHDLDDSDLSDMLGSLSKESKTLVKILKTVISKHFKTEMDLLRDQIIKKDTVIDSLQSEVKDLKDKVSSLESHVDRVEQYERRDTIIISGPSLPSETPTENASDVVISAVKDILKLNIKQEDISVAHRLGTAQPGRDRPIIVKLVNRSLKYDVMGACIQLRPRLYVNESLTPKRLEIFRKVLAIRRQHRPKFQQCFTKDGSIIVKLKHSAVRHTIVDDQSLADLLDKYPYMKETLEAQSTE